MAGWTCVSRRGADGRPRLERRHWRCSRAAAPKPTRLRCFMGTWTWLPIAQLRPLLRPRGPAAPGATCETPQPACRSSEIVMLRRVEERPGTVRRQLLATRGGEKSGRRPQTLPLELVCGVGGAGSRIGRQSKDKGQKHLFRHYRHLGAISRVCPFNHAVSCLHAMITGRPSQVR